MSEIVDIPVEPEYIVGIDGVDEQIASALLHGVNTLGDIAASDPVVLSNSVVGLSVDSAESVVSWAVAELERLSKDEHSEEVLEGEHETESELSALDDAIKSHSETEVPVRGDEETSKKYRVVEKPAQFDKSIVFRSRELINS